MIEQLQRDRHGLFLVSCFWFRYIVSVIPGRIFHALIIAGGHLGQRRDGGEPLGETKSRQIRFMVLLKHLFAKSLSPGMHSKREMRKKSSKLTRVLHRIGRQMAEFCMECGVGTSIY